MKIKHGIGTWVTLVVALLGVLPPAIQQLVAFIENVSVHWGSGEEISLIVGAASAAVLLLGKVAQAVAAILKGSTNV